MPHPKDPVRLKEWCEGTVDDYSKRPADWNAYDSTFIVTVSDYNIWLDRTAGYRRLDWMLVKAFAWVETGPGSTFWKDRVLQIGNPGDLGLGDLLHNPNSTLIVPPQYRPWLTLTSVKHDPLMNIRAGVGYLLLRSAHFGLRDVPVEDDMSSLDRFYNSVTPGLRPLEPTRPLTRLAQLDPAAQPWGSPPLRTRKQIGITGWRTIDLHLIAARYNVAGDGNYYDKLVYAYDLIVRGVPKPSGATK